jgi:hypothetical protein
MLFRILDTPLLDVLLLLILLRIIFPSLFRGRARAKESASNAQSVFHSTSTENQKSKQEEGEYIDYEEIK